MKQKRKFDKKQILVAVLLMVGIVLSGGFFVWGIHGQQPEVVENPVQGINAASSFKGYLGKGYAYAGPETDDADGIDNTDMQAQTLEEPEEEQEEETIQENPEETEPDTAPAEEQPQEVYEDTSNEENPFSEDENAQDSETVPDEIVYDNENKDEEDEQEAPEQDDDTNQDQADLPPDEDGTDQVPEENRYPSVATDLTDGETVQASYRTFYVQAYDYQGNVLSSAALEVTGNGQKLYSIGTDGQGIVSYRLELNDGSNTVSIRVTDNEGWSTTIPEYTIYKGADEQPQPEGSITISIEAGTVGLGMLLAPQQVEYYQGEQLASVLLRTLDANGFDWRNVGEATSGFYLRSIGRSGMTAGAAIPDELMAHLNEVNSQLTSHDNDWLGEFDFTMDSGWLYFVNGEYMNTGMSGYFPADGDVVRLRFSLYAGADVGAGQNGETWGDW
ncbi:DUF4430 domain-containing protein [Blautia sp. MSJ-19]|uniref:DUF4430 domain-containing protein n=1 Tax=Blautia sp. MSJ-19 TaxID=2841517 RepID=UPI001C0ECC2B|nr:DUF4430 domain-containing protein [Blautia sp. MSJ-19]MBU5479725.1 DUF4430 domain-containing protein [Blautia sp. MSJ-19]